MTDPEITFNANPTQKAFINSRAEADLFSSRKGEGKSTALCWACWYHTRNNPGAQWAIIRDTWTNLRRTTLAEFFRWFPAGVWGTWHEQNREFTWNPHLMGPGSRVTFLGLDDKTDAAKVASMPLGGVGLDEPCPAASEGLGIDDFVFTTAMGQLRQPGMRWYAAKIAQNNSDETHWTYRRFVDPGTGPHGGALLPLQEPGFRLWQPVYAENTANLKPGYYEAMRREWADRPDLVSRFVDGKITNQLIGRPVTPEWDDNVHLARELVPVRGTDLILCWDWGNTPACAITQLTPLGHWLILETHVGVDVGVYELITDQVKPALRDRYRRFKWWHTGDPSGARKEQSSVDQSAVRVVKKELGGVWRPGPQDPMDGVPALRSVMRSIGRVKVDRTRAKEAWWALRGGWHFPIARSGVAGGRPVKDVHCVPLDTEILTARGFLNWGDVQVGDICYGWDRDSGELVDDTIQAVNHTNAPVQFLSFSSMAMDGAFTAEHRCLATRRVCPQGGTPRVEPAHVVLAKDINTAHRFVISAPWRGRKAKDREVSDDFVRLAAWVMTEGYYRKTGQIWIGQKTYASDVAQLADTFPGTVVRRHGENGSVLVALRWETAFLLRKLMPNKAPSPEFCRMMTAGQRRAFLYEAMRGDGTTKGKWPNLKTNPSSNRELLRGGASWRLALADAHQSDAVQHIAALLGLRTSVSLRKNYRLVTLWQRAGDAQVGKMQRSEFVHAGAWCPTTETGFWVARRSGRLFITGNSHIGDALAHGAAVIFPLGTLRERKPATPPKEASW